MSCPHAAEQTLLWLYGEGPEAHLHHVATCAECQEVVAEHEEVAAAVAPVLPALRAPPVRSGRRAWRALGVLALAAAVLVFVRVAWVPAPAPVADTDLLAPVAEATALAIPFDSELDMGLDALDFEVDTLSHELSTL